MGRYGIDGFGGTLAFIIRGNDEPTHIETHIHYQYKFVETHLHYRFVILAAICSTRTHRHLSASSSSPHSTWVHVDNRTRDAIDGHQHLLDHIYVNHNSFWLVVQICHLSIDSSSHCRLVNVAPNRVVNHNPLRSFSKRP